MDLFKKLFTSALLATSLLANAATIEQALEARKQQHYQQSIDLLDKAQGDPALIQYLLGYNYNRLHQPKAALKHLKRAKRLGFKGASLYLEQGLANYQRLNLHSAIADFKRYDRARPGNAKVHELLGRCYALLGQDKEASVHFNTANKNPSLKPGIAKFQKDLRLFRALPSNRLSDKPWSFSASLGGGYNSNVIALGNTTPLPEDISRQGSAFAELLLYGHYQLKKTDDSRLNLLYQFLGDGYETESSLNYAAPSVALSYQKTLNEKSAFNLVVANDNSWVGGSRFSSFFIAKPSLSYQYDDWNLFELLYTYNYQNYFTPTVSVQNRDGFQHYLALSDTYRLQSSNAKVRFGYSSAWNNTKGGDFAYQADGLFFGLQKSLRKKVTLDALYNFEHYQYKNLNSLAEPNGFAFRRRDNTHHYVVQLTKEFKRKRSGYLRYENFNDSANIPFYSYKQYIISLGLTANWD